MANFFGAQSAKVFRKVQNYNYVISYFLQQIATLEAASINQVHMYNYKGFKIEYKYLY